MLQSPVWGDTALLLHLPLPLFLIRPFLPATPLYAFEGTHQSKGNGGRQWCALWPSIQIREAFPLAACWGPSQDFCSVCPDTAGSHVEKQKVGKSVQLSSVAGWLDFQLCDLTNQGYSTWWVALIFLQVMQDCALWFIKLLFIGSTNTQIRAALNIPTWLGGASSPLAQKSRNDIICQTKNCPDNFGKQNLQLSVRVGKINKVLMGRGQPRLGVFTIFHKMFNFESSPQAGYDHNL